MTAAPSTTKPATRPPRRRSLRQENRAGLLLSSPAVIGLIVFVGIPFVIAIVLSFYNAQLNSPRPPNFIGTTQYTRLFADSDFWRSLINNVSFALIVIPVQTGLALGLALLVNTKLRGIAIYRAIFFLPVIFPMALVAVIWRLILDRSPGGLLNASISLVSGGHLGPYDWLGMPQTALISVIALSIWQGVGFQMIILLAGLQEIPAERYEAAELDRANPWQRFWHITVPGLRNTLIFVVLLTSILSFRVYDQVYIMIKTAGANEQALQTVLYQATSSLFDQNNLGRAAAITVVFFVIVLGMTLVQRRLLRQEEN